MDSRLRRGGARSRAWNRFASVLLVAVCLTVPSARAQAGTACATEPGLLQLELDPATDIDAVNAVWGTSLVDSLAPLYLLSAPSGADVDSLIALMSLDPLLPIVEPAYLGQTPEGKRQMMVAAVGDTISAYIDQGAADRVGVDPVHAHGTGEGVTVAVIDTGVAADHPALAGVVLPGFDYVELDSDPDDTANGIDDDLDGLTDDAAGHGTMIAGIIHLVAPGADILPLRVLDDEGHGRTFDVAKAIRRAVEDGAHIVNLSLGLDCVSGILEAEIARADSAGVTLVAAAGNDDAEDPAIYPASDARTLSVAALDSLDLKAGFASYHPTVSLSAPGTGIVAPFHDGNYGVGAGSSFSAPWVSGQAALVRGFNPSLAKADIDAVCMAGATDIYGLAGNSNYIDKLGTGRLDLVETWMQTPVAASVEGHDLDGDPPGRLQVSPNPSTPGSEVLLTFAGARELELDFGASLQIDIVDVTGRVLRRLTTSSDAMEWRWDGRDERGRPVAAGVYFAGLSGAFPGGNPALGSILSSGATLIRLSH